MDMIEAEWHKLLWHTELLGFALQKTQNILQWVKL